MSTSMVVFSKKNLNLLKMFLCICFTTKSLKSIESRFQTVHFFDFCKTKTRKMFFIQMKLIKYTMQGVNTQ